MKEKEEIEITPEEIESFRKSIARAKALKKALEKAGVLKEIEELERGEKDNPEFANLGSSFREWLLYGEVRQMGGRLAEMGNRLGEMGNLLHHLNNKLSWLLGATTVAIGLLIALAIAIF